MTKGCLNGKKNLSQIHFMTPCRTSSTTIFVHRQFVMLRYPVALFNELYYLNAGGTIWTGNQIILLDKRFAQPLKKGKDD
jgi:hypothetical protein